MVKVIRLISSQFSNAFAISFAVGWTAPLDIQMSPKKALRAAMLKSRFADTILKAQKKTFLDHVMLLTPFFLFREKNR